LLVSKMLRAWVYSGNLANRESFGCTVRSGNINLAN
jgi:hypothetical protein